MKMKTAGWILGIVLTAAAGAQATEWSTNLPCFYGGDYDGWDMQTNAAAQYLGDDIVTLSSGTNQDFLWTTPSAALTSLAITVVSYSTAPITNGTLLRISVPAAWSQSAFDPGSAAALSGGAAGKVGAPYFTNDQRTLAIPVTSAFASNDTLVVDGLKLVDLRLAPTDPANLELAFSDNPRDLYDEYPLQVHTTWAGGDYDGWDAVALDEAMSLHGVRGTIIWMSWLAPQ